MARRAGRRGGIIKLYPPPLPSQQLPANHQPHFMKGGRGGEGRERKERRRGKIERQGGQRKGRGGRIKERREEKRREERGRRKEKGRDEAGMDGGENGEYGREMGRLEEGGSEGGEKGQAGERFQSRERKEGMERWRQDTRQLLSILLQS